MVSVMPTLKGMDVGIMKDGDVIKALPPFCLR